MTRDRRTNPVSGAAKWRRGVGWGWIWGRHDEMGALNAMTDASRLAAISSIKTGRVYDLGVTIDGHSFSHSAHPSTQVITYRTAEGLAREQPMGAGHDDTGFNTSIMILSDHAGTQIDGLCHTTTGTDRHWYNGFATSDWAYDFGPGRAGAHNIPPIIAPGVLIDVAGVRGVPQLESGEPIQPQQLERALDAQSTQVEPGDVVLVRTGSLGGWGAAGSDHEALRGPDTAGLTLRSARWLIEECGALLIGSDTSTLEVVPAVDGDRSFPVHAYALVEQGVHLGELHNLEELAADRVYRFCYVALSPRVRATTAAFALRPIALV